MDEESYRRGIAEFEEVLARDDRSLAEKIGNISAMWASDSRGWTGNISHQAILLELILEDIDSNHEVDRETLASVVEYIKKACEGMYVQINLAQYVFEKLAESSGN